MGIFGEPVFEADSNGISSLRYTVPQGIKHVIETLADRLRALKKMRLMLVPVEKPIGRRNRMQWALRSFEVGQTYDEETDDMRGGFVVRVEVNDFGSVMTPTLEGKLSWLINFAIPSRERLIMLSCYTPEGYYLGDLDTAGWLYFRHGLTHVQPICVVVDPSKRAEAIQEKWACQVGFDEKNQRWVGWSHRAIAWFPVGYIAKEGDCVVSSGWTDEYLAEHPEENLTVPVGFEVKTLDDSKRCAIAFAESVG